jgi:thioredoxin-like negative regulator of GroEL
LKVPTSARLYELDAINCVKRKNMPQSEKSALQVEMAQQLVNIGLLASIEGMGREADIIFLGAIAEFPDLCAVKLTYAVTLVSTGRHAEALDWLRTILKEYPGHMLAKSVSALLQREMGQAQWRTYARAVISNGNDDIAVELAKALLGDEVSPATRSPRVFPGATFA